MNKKTLFLAFVFGIFLISFVSAESGMVIFQNSTAAFVATPQYKIWNESDFSATFNATAEIGTLQWVVVKNNPINEQVVLGTTNSSGATRIRFYNSTNNWSTPDLMTLASGVTTTRGFDIEIEQLSGEIMVVYNNGTAGVLAYKTWSNDSGWSAESRIINNLTGQVNWVKMAADRNSNNIMLAAADANARLTAVIWNGTGWSTSFLLETALFTIAKQNFDIAYENSGDALLVWAETVTAYPKYITYSNNSWGVEGSGPASSGQAAGFQWFRLAGYPNTDRIMMCYVDSAADYNCAEWTGNGWGSVTEITAAGEYSNGASFRNFDVVPDTSSQSFFLVYALNNEDYYRTIRCFGQSNCQAGIWENAQSFLSGVDIGTDTAWASLVYDPENVGKITALMMDQTAASNVYLARISCANSANSCAAEQTSTLFSVSTNEIYESVGFTYFGRKPTLQNISTSSPVASSTIMTISANNVNDTNENSLNFYCSSSSIPTVSNTICTGGNTSVNSPYAGTSCSFTSQSSDGAYATYCRVYDGDLYSSVVNLTYVVSSSAPTTSVVSVAGDTVASYIDTVNDGATLINVSGESGMTCRWAGSDLAYSAMSNPCTTQGIYSSCNITGISSEGFYTRYVSCANSLGIGQSNSQNLDIGFYLDYTAPTTSDNSNTDVQVPGYSVTITEGDAVDADPKTTYCTDTTDTCIPGTNIDSGGQVIFSTRGVNYLRYNSTDFTGNTQTIVSKTININQLPIMVSTVDNAVTIKGGGVVNITTNSSEGDAGQTLSLFVCNSTSSVSYLGCGTNNYCNATGIGNITCIFNSESDSSSHSWFAYIFDSLNESASANPLSGSYTTDSTAPILTVSSPGDGQNITQGSLTFAVISNEVLSSARYSLDYGINNVTMSNSSLFSYSHINSSIADGYYNVTFYANDSYGNNGNTSIVSFRIDTTVPDSTAPTLTIISPGNGSYYTSAGILLNISSNENLSWAGYRNNSGVISSLDNTSVLHWNKTISLSEGTHIIEFYGNDSLNNQGNANTTFYVDLNNPSLWVYCDDVNESKDVYCLLNISDAVGLDYYILSYNFTGIWQNSSQIDFNGLSLNTFYNISSGNTTPGTFGVELYVYDLSGRSNSTSRNITVTDDSFPEVYNITYYPNTTDALDPGIRVNVNATIVENYNISSVDLMWLNQSDGDWISVAMTNLTSINYTGFTNTIFNASFIPQNGTYYFKINATDTRGNQNISANTTISVTNDTSYFNSTTIPEIKSITYAQRTDNNTLGELFLNNTGDDSQLNFIINISSSIRERFDINYTASANATYAVSAGEAVNLSIFANTSSLSAGLYDYNITISSSAGTSIIQKKLNVQTAEGPYLSVSIDSYSSSVTRGQTEVTLSASVTNLGTQDAQNVDLNWTLPSEFTLASGSLSRNFVTVPIGLSNTNTITIDVSNSANVSSVNISALSSASNANSSNATKTVAITNPLTITQTVTNTVTVNTGGGGGAGSGGGGGAVVISKTIEVTRGDEMKFNVDVFNKYPGKRLEGLTLTIIGFPEKYISVNPKTINNVEFNKTSGFLVTLTAPTYKSREEHLIQAIIKGKLVEDKTVSDYSETQNIKLIIQEVSSNETLSLLELAMKAIEQMKEKTFNIIGVDRLYAAAMQSLQNKHNEEAKRIADEIVLTKNTAFAAFDLIGRLKQAMDDPKKMNLVTSNVPNEFVDQNGNVKTSQSLLTGNVVFAGQSVIELVDLAQAAFDRGDYSTALERAKNAQVMLILERKGNFGLFLYLYWYYIIAAIVLIAGFGIYGLRGYRKANISGKILDLEREEQTIRVLMITNQKEYLSAKISSADYHKNLAQHTKRLADIQKERVNLRENRIKLLPQTEVSLALDNESVKLENQIKSLQTRFYVEHKVPESEYRTQFAAFNEQLTEIEGEKIELNLKEKEQEGEKEGEKQEEKKQENEKHDAGKKSIFDFVKKHFKEKDLKGKYIKINIKPHDKNKHGGNKK